MDVQFHGVIEKASIEEQKRRFSHTKSPTQYEWNIERELDNSLVMTAIIVSFWGFSKVLDSNYYSGPNRK